MQCHDDADGATLRTCLMELQKSFVEHGSRHGVAVHRQQEVNLVYNHVDPNTIGSSQCVDGSVQLLVNDGENAMI